MCNINQSRGCNLYRCPLYKFSTINPPNNNRPVRMLSVQFYNEMFFQLIAVPLWQVSETLMKVVLNRLWGLKSAGATVSQTR